MSEETTQVHSAEIEDVSAGEMAQSIRDFSASALAVLNERREARYAEACASLNEELTALASESADLEAKNQVTTERLASTERVLRFELDQLIMRGENTEAKQASLEEVKAGAAQTEKRRSEIAERCRQIETAKKTELRRTAESFLSGCTGLIRGAEGGLALILDGARSTLNGLETEIGASVYRPDQLTADEKSEVWVTLSRLYSVRTR
jgi:chromosome segregation ATPase